MAERCLWCAALAGIGTKRLLAPVRRQIAVAATRSLSGAREPLIEDGLDAGKGGGICVHLASKAANLRPQLGFKVAHVCPNFGADGANFGPQVVTNGTRLTVEKAKPGTAKQNAQRGQSAKSHFIVSLSNPVLDRAALNCAVSQADCSAVNPWLIAFSLMPGD